MSGILKLISVFLGIVCFQNVYSVNLSQNNQGQVLLFPYVQTTAATSSELSIVNSTNKSKALKIRFLNPSGELVTTLNLYLSPYDSWAGRLVLGEDQFMQIITKDKSCLLKRDNFKFQEGSIEVLEMGTLNASTDVKNCQLLNENWLSEGVFHKEILDAPTSGLFGRATIFMKNTAFVVQPIALEAWRSSSLHTPPGSVKPDLSDVYPKVSYFMSNMLAVKMSWNNGNAADPVTSLFMASEIHTSYKTDATQGIRTDIVYYQPTRVFYPTDLECKEDEFKFYDRNYLYDRSQKFNKKICSANFVLSINNAKVLSSSFTDKIIDLNLTNGNLALYVNKNKLTSDEGHSLFGIPILGVSFQEGTPMSKTWSSTQKSSYKKDFTLKEIPGISK